MAQSPRFLDDLARLVTDAAGAAQGVRREVETVAKGQMQRVLNEMEVARREEVEVLRDLVAAVREESEAVRAQVAALEERVAALEGRGRSEGASGDAHAPAVS